MYCGNCLRDNALVSHLRKLGHQTEMIPLYLPMTLDEQDESAGTPLFFGGINVYLDQKFSAFRQAPAWVHRWLDSPWLLRLAAGRAASTRAEQVGELTLSMLRGEEGNQIRELDELIAWLRTQPRPDVISLSNALLIGLTRRLRSDLGVPVVCMLQGEAPFLDSLPPAQRASAWQLVSERAADVDLFVASSRFFAALMADRLGLAEHRIKVVYNGIPTEDYTPSALPVDPPVLGYFARMCRDKGLDMLVETFIRLKRRNRIPRLKLRVGGGLLGPDQLFVRELQEKLTKAGFAGDAEFVPNVTRAEKIAFYRSLSVVSVPALYGEAFGLYIIEAMAAGVPVVQPRHGAFPELVHETGGGIITEANAESLADGIERLLLNPHELRELGKTGRAAVLAKFTVDRMSEGMLKAFEQAKSNRTPLPN